MRLRPIVLAALVSLVVTLHVRASGPLGVYGIVEKVAFEPSEAAPDRIQLWGAFSFVEGPMPEGVAVISRSQRGYLYFRVPAGLSQIETTAIKREWVDLKSVAGTGQAVGFGRWPGGVRPEPPGAILPSQRDTAAALRVRPADENPAGPADYQTNAGIVKLSEQGSNGWIVKQLREALKR